MTLDIKICGLKTRETLEAALQNGASHIGFVFFEKSPRHATLPLASSLRKAIGGRACAVAVTVDADNTLLDEIVFQVKPDLLQLHGAETPRRVAEIRNRYKLPVMKAIGIHNAADLQNIVPYEGIADRILFDARPPKEAGLPGGNGVSFDWSVLNALDEGVDYMLSGGLKAENVACALAQTRACGIDVSSGVEAEPGVKDIRLIDDFFAAVATARKHGAEQDGE